MTPIVYVVIGTPKGVASCTVTVLAGPYQHRETADAVADVLVTLGHKVWVEQSRDFTAEARL